MKSSQIFKSIFIGELVEMMAKLSANENSPVLQIQGYLLDVDNDYYYLGKDFNEVTDCIKKEIVGHINIIKPIDPIVEILNQLPIVETKNAN